MSLLALWLTASAITGISLAFVEWWSIENYYTENLTLSNLITGIFLSLCPVIQIIVLIYCVTFFLTEVTPKIVLFGRK